MDNLILKRDLTAEQLSLVEGELERRKKSKGALYLLWFFTGGIGGHRYYLGDVGRGIAMTFTLGGLGIWAFIDVFFIGGRLEEKTIALEREIIEKVKVITNGRRESATTY